MTYRELFEKVGIDIDLAKARLCRPGSLTGFDYYSSGSNHQHWQAMRLGTSLCTPDLDLSAVCDGYIPSPKEMVKTANALASIAKMGIGIPYYCHVGEYLLLEEHEFSQFMSKKVIRLDGPYYGVAGDRAKFFANLMQCAYETIVKNNTDRLHKSFYIKRYVTVSRPLGNAHKREVSFGHLIHTATRNRILYTPMILDHVLRYMEKSHYHHTGIMSEGQVTRKLSNIKAHQYYLAGKVSSYDPDRYARAIRDPEYRAELENELYLSD